MLTGESEAKAKTKAMFDEVYKRYTDTPSEKKKSKKNRREPDQDILLESLKKKFNITKQIEGDKNILKNPFQPEESSPHYTTNHLQERESPDKNIRAGLEACEGRRRALPDPPDENMGRKPSRRKVEKTGRDKDDMDDELLQEYQRQISQEEERAVKTFSTKEMIENRDQEIVANKLNNDPGKKKKKQKSHEPEADPPARPAPQDSQSEESTNKLKAKPKNVSSDVEREGIREEAVPSEGQDETDQKPKGRKKKRIQKAQETSEPKADTQQRPTFDDSLVLGVNIHKTDQLKTDLLVSHPMVKIHVIDEVTGQYVKKENSHRPVSSFYEQDKVEHILPIMTQPYDFKKNKSTIPEWEELIIFNERFNYFLQDNDESPIVVLFFEILDFMTMDEAKANMDVDRQERGFRKIAWAFLKLVGTNGVLNVDSKLRLQLYCPPTRAKKQSIGVEVVEWWKRCPRNRYASTLYVTVKGLKLPEYIDPSIRSMMALQQERGSTSYGELQDELSKKATSRSLADKTDTLKWSRVPGQVCRIPNKQEHSFRGGQMGCIKLSFSHNGRRLASACADRDAFPIVVYEIPSGKVLSAFNGHLSIVYDLCWSRDDHSLVSASSDGTVRIWNVERLQLIAKKILPHPAFVYCAQYHPSSQNLVVTGGYDCLIRVWNISVQDVNGQLLHELDGHNNFINTLCFESEGLWMFSGDSSGLIIMWNTVAGDGFSYKPSDLWNIEREIAESDLSGISISNLEIHPNGRRLLIHAKDSVVRVMDLRILAVKKYTGATNYREKIHSTFTPCGTFIFSGSEDGMAYVWNADTGDRVAVYSELGYTTPLRDVAFHPHENMVAFCSFGENQPILVFLYDRKAALMEVGSLEGLKPSTTSAKVSRRTADIPDSSTAMDQFSAAARLSLKMQKVKQKLDSVLISAQNPSIVEFPCKQGGVSYIVKDPLLDCRSFKSLRSNPSLPVPSLLSPHSKLPPSGQLATQLVWQTSLASDSGSFSPVGQRINSVPSLRLQTGSAHWLETDSVVSVQQTVVSLYDYNANRSDELTVHRGDTIQVLYKDNDNWWFGRLANGQQGYFPANYVADQREFEEELSHTMETIKSNSEHLSLSAERATPTKVSAAMSARGDLPFISENDSDLDASAARRTHKKKAKKEESVLDPDVLSSSGKTMVKQKRGSQR